MPCSSAVKTLGPLFSVHAFFKFKECSSRLCRCQSNCHRVALLTMSIFSRFDLLALP